MRNDVEIGLFLLPDQGDAARTVELIVLCEEVGLSFVGVADSQMLWDDVHVILGAAAARTNRIRLGPWVTNAVTRHETVTANAICTLDDLSGGRAFLGMGYGDSSVRLLGLRPRRLAELESTVARMRALVAGEAVETEHGIWHLTTARRRLEVYWAADGPRSLESAGAHADAVIANGLLVPEHMRFMTERVRAGAVAAGRAPNEVDIIFNTGLSISEHGSRARDIAKTYVARTLCRDLSAWIPEWTGEKAAEFRAAYDYYHHIDQRHRAAGRVPDHLVTTKAVAGTPEECAAQLRDVIDHGFSRIALLALGEDPETVIRRLSAEVIPAL